MGGENIKRILVFGILIMLLFVLNPVAADDNITINELNVYDYFTEENILEETYSNRTFIIEGELNNHNVLDIKASNTTFIGSNASLRNTVFKLNANSITLLNLSMNLTRNFEDNGGAGVNVLADNITISNLNISYVVPKDITAYGIYSRDCENISIINNNIYFEAHNDRIGLNYAITMHYINNLLIENNTVYATFPLRSVDYDSGSINAPLTISVQNCRDYVINNNNITTNVNKRPFSTYPTLVCLYIIGSENGIVSNNNISMEDYITGLGLVNYIYGIDVHTLSNLTIISNNVHMMTTGGILAAGAAYPIQMTGPLSVLNITNNTLYSFSNGPNLGIYSMNYYGDTAVSITDNIINVTGLAGEHEWALVAGIEVQDSNDTIKNNIIEVHSVADVGENDNLYGISYRQNTEGEHTFDIEDNTIFSEAYHGIYLLSAVNSTIKNNVLVTTRDVDDISYSDMYKEGEKEHVGNTYFNNTIQSSYYYWSKILNDIDGGENTTYETPENTNNLTNNINGSEIKSESDTQAYPSANPISGDSTNPRAVIPNPDDSDKSGSNSQTTDFTRNSDGENDYTNQNSNGEWSDYTARDDQSQWSDYTHQSDENTNSDLWDDYTSSHSNNNENNFQDNSNNPQNNGISLPNNPIASNTTSNTQGGEEITSSNNGETITNSSSNPAAEGEDSSISKDVASESSSSDSPSDSGGSVKVYEVTKKIEDDSKPTNIIIPIIGAIIVAVLFLIGWRRKQEFNEY